MYDTLWERGVAERVAKVVLHNAGFHVGCRGCALEFRTGGRYWRRHDEDCPLQAERDAHTRKLLAEHTADRARRREAALRGWATRKRRES